MSVHKNSFLNRIFKIVSRTVYAIALLLFLAVLGLPFLAQGGCHKASPNEKYELRVMAPFHPNLIAGWSYTITLLRRPDPVGLKSEVDKTKNAQSDSSDDHASSKTIETLTLTPHDLPLINPRGQPDVIRWSNDSDYVDVYIQQRHLCRLYIPEG